MLPHPFLCSLSSILFLPCPQEVSAFGDEGEGDHLDEWTVQCGGSVWKREEAVRFRHKSTDALLSVTGEQYGRPIHGQREVHAMMSPSQHSLWRAMEGIFMKPSESPVGSRDYSHPHTEFWTWLFFSASVASSFPLCLPPYSYLWPQLHLYQQLLPLPSCLILLSH